MLLAQLSSSGFNPPQPPLQAGNSILMGFFIDTSVLRQKILLLVVQSG